MAGTPDIGHEVAVARASDAPVAQRSRSKGACSSCGAPLAEDASFCTSCGRALESGLTWSARVDGRYVIGAELGRGGMGVVYRAEDVELDRPVALKLISPSVRGVDSTLAQFRREARALAAVRSDHVVRVYSYGVHSGSPYFAMELVVGQTLASSIDAELDRDAVLPIHQSLRILTKSPADSTPSTPQGSCTATSSRRTSSSRR